jgi:hypothetical protein
MKTAINIIVALLILGVMTGFFYLLVKADIREKTRFPDRKKSEIAPIIKDSVATSLEMLGKYRVAAGNLYVYKLGSDTIYLVEGASSNYPVSITVR